MGKTYDFSGWATRNNLKCSDGRTIMKDAFKNNDGKTVPLVWNHRHNDPENVLGHALLENRNEGVYAYCTFNDTEAAKNAKLLVEHGDISALSIYANQLKQQGSSVLHGTIRELSLVLAGANPGAFIDSVIQHGEESEDSAIIFTGEEISLAHSDSTESETNKNEGDKEMEEKKKTQSGENKTLKEIIDTMTEEQKTAMYAMVGLALEENNSEGDKEMKHNVFSDSNDEYVGTTKLTHSEMQEILKDGKRCGSLRDSFIQHGIDDIEYLFPDAKNVTNTPIFIDRNQEWVKKVMDSVAHTPFSRIKSLFADITEEDARAKGYIKGKQKKDEVFGLLKRTTAPTTVYKKQKLDRDDIVDITDFDVVAWIKSEMRGKLDEELARAFLVGDGRSSASDDKINESNIRPIWTDDPLFTIKATVTVAKDASEADRVKAFIRACIKSRKEYQGSGNPSLYTTEDVLTACLLLEDANGRIIYDSEEKLKKTLRVSDIVTVSAMEGLTRTGEKGETRILMGLIANLKDYRVGADKGGAVNMFDDFDIDYNAQKYLIETRCSGALVTPHSAIAVEMVEATTSGTNDETTTG